MIDYKRILVRAPRGMKTIKAITLQISLSYMPTVREPRIELNPQALKAITIWSSIEDKDPGDLIKQIDLGTYASESAGCVRIGSEYDHKDKDASHHVFCMHTGYNDSLNNYIAGSR